MNTIHIVVAAGAEGVISPDKAGMDAAFALFDDVEAVRFEKDGETGDFSRIFFILRQFLRKLLNDLCHICCLRILRTH